MTRGQSRHTVTLEVGEQQVLDTLTWNGTDAQRALLAQWFGAAPDWKPGASLSLSSFENFHGIQQVV